jgi:hypothetical protein
MPKTIAGRIRIGRTQGDMRGAPGEDGQWIRISIETEDHDRIADIDMDFEQFGRALSRLDGTCHIELR